MKAKKQFGQHFLRDPEVLQEIVEVADLGRSAGALEIGPGEGALTAFLVRAGVPVVALEKDRDAVAAVRDRLRGVSERFTLVEGDALQVDLETLLPPATESGSLPVVVGNLPYNAATAILGRLLTLGPRVARHVLMFQREVAHRIVAQPGSKAYGALTVETYVTARAWMLRDIPPEAFAPRPKVHSTVILLEPRPEPLTGAEEHKPFTHWVHGVFRARRKTLERSLGCPELLRDLDIDPEARPETLSPETLLQLYRALTAGGGET